MSLTCLTHGKSRLHLNLSSVLELALTVISSTSLVLQPQVTLDLVFVLLLVLEHSTKPKHLNIKNPQSQQPAQPPRRKTTTVGTSNKSTKSKHLKHAKIKIPTPPIACPSDHRFIIIRFNVLYQERPDRFLWSGGQVMFCFLICCRFGFVGCPNVVEFSAWEMSAASFGGDGGPTAESGDRKVGR